VVYILLDSTSICTFVGGYREESGAVLAAPNVAEKGKLDVRMEVVTKGGHSSVPPLHTVKSTSHPPALHTKLKSRESESLHLPSPG
jgi:acetylornithine deacetylase/succinyl-diaminopimelate desuccinylase-like protein